MRPLKKSYMIAAVILLLIGFGVEYGGPLFSFFKPALPSPESIDQKIKESPEVCGPKPDNQKTEEERLKCENRLASDDVVNAKAKARTSIGEASPPGYGLKADGLFVWIAFFAMLVSLVGMTVPRASVQRAGMVASLISSIMVIVLSIILIVMAIIGLVIMFTLLAAVPFGPVIYFAIYAFFPVGTVLSMGGIGLACKMGAAILIFFGGSQLLRIKSTILLFLMEFATFLLLSLVLGVTGPFAAIADAILGIIISIVAIIWSVVVLVGAIKGLLSKIAG